MKKQYSVSMNCPDIIKSTQEKMNSSLFRKYLQALDIIVYNVNGDEYVSVNSFCKITGYTRSYIRWLINEGNRFKVKLQQVSWERKYYILLSQFFDYDFTYHHYITTFNETGNSYKKHSSEF